MPFRNAGEGAANHVKAKNEWMQPKKQAVTQMKVMAQPELLALEDVNELVALPPPIHAVTISGKRSPDGVGGESRSPSQPPLSDEDERELAERAKRQQEKRRRANPALYQHVGID